MDGKQVNALQVKNQQHLQFGCEDGFALDCGELSSMRAIEDEHFPFEFLSDIAEAESWRKEINRPIYHIHKWWAQRLGTVFRAIVLGVFAPKGAKVSELFYQPVRLPNAVVFDPFMGSGTTVGETLKLGARAVGRDINPVASFLVRTALSIYDRSAILRAFQEIERDVSTRIKSFYQTKLPDGRFADVLYYFWVKIVECPKCSNSVDLFANYVFAQHAYRIRHPRAHAICAHCGEVNEIRYDTISAKCSECRNVFHPQNGPAKGQKASCPNCEHVFPIAKTIKESGKVPQHRNYAKLVLLPDGTKTYLRSNEDDFRLYRKAERVLRRLKNAFPTVKISPGYNTNQVLGYNYTHWHEMFNARQLVCISILSDRVASIEDPSLRDLFVCLLSGTLEFNNLFTSYKGEGTGAVRHMFAHHILKPERTPLEANFWGTPKSSGSFLTLFNGRIKRALDYAEDPFELRLTTKTKKSKSEKVYGLSKPLSFPIASTIGQFEKGMSVYLSSGDSSRTDLAEHSVDAVITDPPFFDNVHYSELADFFYVWQQHILRGKTHATVSTTRSADEVQNGDVKEFTTRLFRVWAEAHRVLKRDGVLTFTYHHSRIEGWRSVLEALMDAGFAITAAQPIKSEMSVAMPKHQAKEPINLDVIVVCRKSQQLEKEEWDNGLWDEVKRVAKNQVQRFGKFGRTLSRNDVRVILMAQLLRCTSLSMKKEAALVTVASNNEKITSLIEELWSLTNNCSQERERRRTDVSSN